MGLGRHLMRRLVRWAKGKRLARLHGDVLDSNHAMLSLVQSPGFRREHGDAPGRVRMLLDFAWGSPDNWAAPLQERTRARLALGRTPVAPGCAPTSQPHRRQREWTRRVPQVAGLPKVMSKP
jgi:GNAT superfamily N-acetyltransferase